MSVLPISAHSLHQQRVRLSDVKLKRASVFPFFDRQGLVSAWMLVWPPTARIVVIESKPGRARVNWRRELQLALDFAELCDINVDSAAALARLWHFDPWWVLREACFEGHWAVPILKATNCVSAFLEPVRGCYFSHDLSRLKRVTTRRKIHPRFPTFDPIVVPYEPELLPEKPVPGGPAPRVNEWTMDPFWRRAGWPVPGDGPGGARPRRRAGWPVPGSELPTR